ncbi:Protein detoxification 16 [Vitis vinifera]|uniref:Protein detoxification 16 n=1 Tax=Vitis vinifera TaxID=29760 RepID=A0A438H5C9_VITVI|nr:Protein detoxification 16 [Vitis vinifera]
MGSALDTFCGQSFGAKQYHMLGVHKQRAMVVLLLVSIPVAFIWNNTGHILASLGQDPEISAEAGLYAHFMIPSIFAFALLQWLGNKGAALANAISYWINVLLLAIYVRISPSCKKTWTGFSMEALHDVLKFLKLAIPSAIMQCLQVWSVEMMVLLSGLLPNPKLETSVLSISLNIYAILYMIFLGISGATSIRVSNELGAGRTQAALLAVYVALFMVAIEGILVATTLILGRNFWGYSYSSEEKVVNYVGEMMFLLAGSHFIDGIQSVLSGMVRGSGKQKIGALVNLGAYYLAGIPSGALLAFVYHIGGKAKKATDRVYDSMVPVNAISSS